ncbi:MAG: hypothetical protein ACW968_16805 [Candidatus Thorarchaeota archaeon]|jgi:hypothetical protein
MAVAFMAALESTPEIYEEEFDNVLEGRSSLIRERILERRVQAWLELMLMQT